MTIYGRLPTNPLLFQTLIPGLVLWLWAGYPNSVILSGTKVVQWNDLSGNNNNVSQATAGNQPTFIPNSSVYNNQPVLSFTGATPTFLTGTLAAQVLQPFTAYGVWESDNTSNVVCINSANPSCTPLGSGAVGTQQYYTFAGTVLSSVGASSNVPNVVCTVTNGVTSVIYVNNSQLPSNTGTAGASNFGVGLGIGGISPAGSNAMTGKIGSIMLYRGLHTTDQRLRIFQFLGSIYGMGVS
jgi:hypothetical protein